MQANNEEKQTEILLQRKASSSCTDEDQTTSLADQKSLKPRGKVDKGPSDQFNIDKAKLADALAQEELNRQESERLLKMDDRKRSYNKKYEEAVLTNEQIEAYQIKK